MGKKSPYLCVSCRSVFYSTGGVGGKIECDKCGKKDFVCGAKHRPLSGKELEYFKKQYPKMFKKED